MTTPATACPVKRYRMPPPLAEMHGGEQPSRDFMLIFVIVQMGNDTPGHLTKREHQAMKTELEKCMAGETFTADPSTIGLALHAKRLVRLLNACDYDDAYSKERLLRELFGSVGEYVHVDIDFHCEYGKNIHVGSHVIINMNCTFVDNNRIDIGNRVLIASDVKIYTATHSTNPAVRNHSGHPNPAYWCCTYSRPVRIEDEAWIGGGAILLPGVTIGRGSVIGAGAVVTRDVPPYSVAVGNPARVIKSIERTEGEEGERPV